MTSSPFKSDRSVLLTPRSPEAPDLPEPPSATSLEAEVRVSPETPRGAATAPLDEEAGPDAPARDRA